MRNKTERKVGEQKK